MSECRMCQDTQHVLLKDAAGLRHKIMRCPICNAPENGEQGIVWEDGSYEGAVAEFNKIKRKVRGEPD